MADAGAILELSLAGVPQFEIGLSKVSITEVLDTYILPRLAAAGYGYFSRGTIEPTELQDVVLRKVTPLAALRYLCDLFRDDETKRPAELRVRFDPEANKYLIDVLRRIGADATVADLRYKKNLRRTDLTTDSERQTNVVQPFGADLPDGTPSGVGRVAFRLTNVSGLDYEITDPEGGPSPVLFEDQLTGFFVVPDQGVGVVTPNPLVEITACSPGSPATITLADDTGITSGRVYELREDADGTLLSEMPASATITDRKVQSIERGDLLGVRNLVGNGWLRLWPDPDAPPTDCGYFPDNSSAATDYVSQNTDPLYTQYGGKSLRIRDEDSTAGRVVGLRYPIFYPDAKEGRSLHCVKVRVFFKRFAGAAWFYITPRDGITGDVVVDSEGRPVRLTLVAKDNPVEGGYVPTIGSWVDVSLINVDLLNYNLHGVILDVTAGAGYFGTTLGSVDCFVDAVQVTQSVGDAPDGFVEYSGSNALWREGNRVLATFTDPPEHYELDILDLTRLDGSRYPFDALTLGADVRLTDASLSIRGERLRLVEFSVIDYLEPARTQVKVASRWEQFVDVTFAGGAALGVKPTPAVTTTTQPPPGTPPTPPPVPGGTGAAAPVVVTLPIADGADETVMLEQPAEETDYWPTQHPWYDATGQTEVRIIAHVVEAGASGAVLVGKCTATPSDPDSYVTPAARGTLTIPISTVGEVKSGWVALASSAIRDAAWKLPAQGGDGSATPVIGKAHYQFRRAAPVRYSRFYWRSGSPSAAPTSLPGVAALGDFWGCDPPLGIAGWLAPTESDVIAGAGRLLRAKGNAFTGVTTDTTDAHIDVSGLILAFVSPPLASQILTTFPWQMMFAASDPAANTRGYVTGRLVVWRESTDEIVAYGPTIAPGPLWFGFFKKARIGYGQFVMHDAADVGTIIPSLAVDPDYRLVLVVGGAMDTGCGGLQTTEGLGISVEYNGSYDAWADGTEILVDPTGGTASYLDIPDTIRFASEDA